MSNNNPHGHISQPTQNPAWNHLQIPSYIPRQPQLAHMSNERSMVRSPSAWHAPAPPPDSIYNFMSANHKNLEHQMNSLLPRTLLPPFDSMDLSLQSSRSSTSPLSKSGSHTSSMLQHEYGHKQTGPPQSLPPPLPHQQTQQQQQQQQHQHAHQQQQQQTQSQLHAPNNYPIHNLSSSSPSNLAHSQQPHQQQSQHSTHHQQLTSMSSPVTTQHSHVSMQGAGMSATTSTASSQSPASPAGTAAISGTSNSAKYLNTNGNDCENMLSPVTAAGASAVSGSNGSGITSTGPNPGHYMREAHGDVPHMSDSFPKVSHSQRNYEADVCLQNKNASKPVELVNKDCSYTAHLSNKMPPHSQQQVSPKKLSPLRNYHAQQQHHQQQGPYNPPAMKHNGPHTPPSTQSPVIHQSGNASVALHGPGSIMDYNQLHLQQQQPHSQNNYAHHQHHTNAQQQQQQHMSSHLQPPQHAIHYTHSHIHHTHHLQQPQQQQHHAQSSHIHSSLHQSQHASHLQQTPLHQPQQQQHQHHHQSSPMHNAPQAVPPPSTSAHHSSMSRLEESSSYIMQNNPKISAAHIENTTIADLSPTSGGAVAPLNYKPTGNILGNAPNCIPDSAESPSPEQMFSNNESLDSNSNSSMECAQRQKDADRKLSRVAPNESETEDLSNAMTRGSGPKSPKSSPPDQSRCSPRPADIKSPVSIDASPTHMQRLSTQLSGARTPPTPPNLQEKTSTEINSPEQKLENGRLATATEAVDAPDEVETIDKISAMIARTAHDNNSNSSIKSGDMDFSNSSPKTKKQRQALKLRNAEYNTASNCSTICYSGGGPTNLSANDNAVAAADELSKDTAQQMTTESNDAMVCGSDQRDGSNTIVATDARPISPHSNSRSSSSSSSSSSCSNTSHSSDVSKTVQIDKMHANCANEMIGTNASTNVGTNLSMENKIDKAGNVNESEKTETRNENGVDLTKNEEPLNLNLQKKETTSFEEIENKLEEMFAGIEDEPTQNCIDTAITAPANATEVARDLSLALELSTAALTIAGEGERKADINTSMKIGDDKMSPLRIRVDGGPPPTKAAKKSTLPSPVASPSPLNTVTQATRVETSDSNTALRKILPPRRRLSVAMDPGNLRIMLENDAVDGRQKTVGNTRSQTKSKELLINFDDDQPSTSAAAAAALAAKTASKGLAGSGGNSTKTSPKSGKQRNSNSNKKGNNQNQQRGATGDTGKSSGSKNSRQSLKNTNKQQNQRRKQQNSSDDDMAPTPNQRDNTNTTEQSKYKSPFILVKSDGSISVVNAPLNAEDVNEKQTRQAKKCVGANYTRDRKNIRGLHSSTLSNKYDADTTDSTWICVFCKRGPHKMGLGDLFGPYLVTTECEEYKTVVGAAEAQDLDALFVSKRRRCDMVQVHPRNVPVVPSMLHATAGTPQLARVGMGKKKRKSTNDGNPIDPLDCSDELAVQHTFTGMTKVSESSYEVWMHEDCIIWAPGVFLVGARVTGLDAAVWNGNSYHCVLCSKPGAMICCLQRDCKAPAHVPCAREAQWSLNEAIFHVYCQRHLPQTEMKINTKALPLASIHVAPVATETATHFNTKATKKSS